MKPFFLLTFISLIMLGTSGFAQQTTRITLQQAIQTAVEKNTDLLKAKNNLESTELEYMRAWGRFLPTLSGSASFNYSEGAQFVAPTIPVVETTNRSYRYGLSSNLNLFNGGNDWYNFQQQTATRENARLSFERTIQNTILSVSSRYLDALQKQELLKNASENLKYQQEQLKKITEMTRLGSRPMVDLYSQQYLTANAELEVINAQKALDLSKAELLSLLALDPMGEYVIETPELANISTVTAPSTLESLPVLLSSALSNRPDYAAAKAAVRVREAAVNQAWGSYSPTLDASWSWGANASDGSNSGPLSPTIPDQLTKNRSWSFGLTLSVPIFTRFSSYIAVEQSSVQLRNANLDVEALERNINIGVKTAYLDFISYKKRLEASEVQFKAASLLRETAQERYNVGAGSFIELTSAIRDFVNASSALTQAKYQYEFQKKVLEFYIGSLKAEDYINTK